MSKVILSTARGTLLLLILGTAARPADAALALDLSWAEGENKGMTVKQKRIYLHIGTRKTGSTLIQTFCQLNKAALGEMRYFYPDTDKASEREGKSAGHWNLHRIFGGQVSGHTLEEYLPIPCPANNVILSNEALTSEHCDIFEMPGRIHKMLAGDFEVTVIVYLRRQDYFINSLYNEGIISGNRKAHCSISKFLEGGHFPEIDYYGLLQSWVRVFGADRVLIRPFERQQLYQGDLLKDFLHCVGIEWQENFITPEEKFANPSPDITLVEAIRQLNRIPLALRPTYRDFLDEVFADFVFNGQYGSGKGQSHLSPSERGKILTTYAPGNEKLAREYLGRADGRLFYEPAPNMEENWQPVAVNDANLVIRLLSSFLRQKALEIQTEFERKDRLIEKRKKENTAIRELLHRQILATFRYSSSTARRRVYRFLRRPWLNEARILQKSGLVDPDYYFSAYPQAIEAGLTAAKHYLRHGAQLGFNPSAEFNTVQYLAHHLDVAQSGINPLVHRELTNKNGKERAHS